MNLTQKERILNEYCDNEMSKLKQFCYPKICKIGGISQMDYDDLYSIALDVLRDSAERYDGSQDCKFSTFLSNNLQNRFDTYVRDRNRVKRKCPGKMEYFDAPTEDGVDLTEKIRSDFCIEDNLSEEIGFSIENNIQNYSPAMQEYLQNLSKVQLKVLELMNQGYNQEEIQDILHITKELYKDSITAITSKKATRKIKKSLRGYKNVR